MARPIRTEAFDLRAAIKAAAWRMISEQGAASLSLRAIARELSITAPAIYNYFPRRADLISALTGDADKEMSDFLTDAHSPHLEDDANIQLRVVCQAYRRWAIENPRRYPLIFTSHAEKNKPGAPRSLSILISIMDSAQKTGKIKKESNPVLPAGLYQPMHQWKQTFVVEDESVLYLATVIWSRVHGLVMNELGNQYPPFIKDPGEFFRFEIKNMINQYLG